MKNHFKCIGIVGHPRHPTALTTHEMLWRWLSGKGYEVLVEQQIAHELQLSNVKTGTLAEIGQVIGVGESRVSQLRSQAIARLRSVLATRMTRKDAA